MPCFGLLAMSALGWFQSRDGFIRLHTSSPAWNGFLRFTSGVTLLTSWWPERWPSHIWSTYLHTYTHWWDLSLGSSMPLPDTCATNWAIPARSAGNSLNSPPPPTRPVMSRAKPYLKNWEIQGEPLLQDLMFLFQSVAESSDVQFEGLEQVRYKEQ